MTSEEDIKKQFRKKYDSIENIQTEIKRITDDDEIPKVARNQIRVISGVYSEIRNTWKALESVFLITAKLQRDLDTTQSVIAELSPEKWEELKSTLSDHQSVIDELKKVIEKAKTREEQVTGDFIV